MPEDAAGCAKVRLWNHHLNTKLPVAEKHIEKHHCPFDPPFLCNDLYVQICARWFDRNVIIIAYHPLEVDSR